MQIYRGMDIGTAKPTAAERVRVPHHLIDVCDVDERFDVKRYIDLTAPVISDIHSRSKMAVIVGGTGLYIRALRRGLFEGPSRNPKLRERLERLGAAELFAELEKADPATATRIDRHNPRRLVRALEVFHETGKPITELQKEWGTAEIPRQARNDSSCVCLDRNREDLYERIERRIDAQIAAGWVEEVNRLLRRGLEKNATARQAAGYRELVAHVRGGLAFDQAVALIKTRTRQLARRQLTWFRRELGLVWLDIGRDESPAETARRVHTIFRQKEKETIS